MWNKSSGCERSCCFLTNPSTWFFFWQKDEENTNQENRTTFTKVTNLQPASLVGHLPHDLQRWDFLVSPSRCPRHAYQDLRLAHQVITRHPQPKQHKRNHPHSSLASLSTATTTKSSTAKQAEQTTWLYRVPTGADTIKATIFSLFNNLLLVQQSSPCCLTIFSLFNNLLLVQQLSQIFSSNVFSQQLFWRSYKIVQFSIVVDNQHFLFSRNSFIIDFQS